MKKMMEHRSKIYRFFGRIFLEEVDMDVFEVAKGVLNEEAFVKLSKDPIAELASDYANIFLGAGKAQGESAFPFESVYTSKKRLVMQEAYEDVMGIYKKKGLSSVSIPDHIGTELEFMVYLCTVNDSNSEALIHEQFDFINNHLLNWVPTFLKDVNKYASTQFYKNVASKLEDFLEKDAMFLEKIQHGEEVLL